MFGITSFVFILVGFVFLVLVAAAIADWLFNLTNVSGARDECPSDRGNSSDGYVPTNLNPSNGIPIDAGGSLFGGCDPGAGAMGGCDAGGAAGGDGGC